MTQIRLVDTLLTRAEREPDGLALVADAEKLTWGDLGARVRGAARVLAGAGVGPKDAVILGASSSTSFVSAYFGTHLLGAVALPVDPRIPAQRLGFIAEAVTPKAIHLARELELPGYTVGSIDDLGRVEDRVTTPLPEEGTRPTDLDTTTADILFTSGTTGRPKGVVLSHGAIGAAARNINAFLRNDASDREVVPLPLSHSFGLGRLRCQVLAGGMIALVDGLTSTAKLFDALSDWKATGLSFVPAGLSVLFKTSGDRLGECADTLEWVEIGSAAMPADDKQRLMSLLPRTRLCMHYGLTEASRSAFVEFHAAGDRLASIGQACPGVEIRIADDSGQPVADGVRGRIVVRSPAAMSEYWNDPEGTRDAFVDGWLITGDVGTRDADGYFYLEAREKDLINVGGREVSPVEIERILEEHPAVAECGCVGVPDPQGISGSVVKAYLVATSPSEPAPKPAQLAKLLRGRIEPYKMPVSFDWIEALPKTSSGKLQRQELAKR